MPTTTTFSKLQTPSKMLQELIQDQSSPVAICMITKEREFPGFQNDFALKNGLLTSLSKNTALIVKLLRNSTG